MSSLYSSTHPTIKFQEADVRSMPSLSTSSIDVAIDKGTLDAMISGSLWDPPDVVKENTGKYIDEVARVLKPGGLFLYVTYRQPHFVKPAIEREGSWDVEVEKIEDPSGGFEYFLYVMRKFCGDENAVET
jgi:SAM-dependent methyltransferase